jgi:hypothetical protein
MPPDRILPGLLTPAAADLLGAGAAQTEENRRAIERMVEEWVDEFPAKLTDWDGDRRACSWTRQIYDSAGRRVDDPLNVTGTPTSRPAYPVGNGLMPPPSFPVEVVLRRRLVTSDGDAAGTPVFEFDWVCACFPGGSSSSSSRSAGA